MKDLSGTGLLLGWTLVLVLWQTALLALLVAAWGKIRPASARRRHRYALATLLAAVPLGILSFWLLAAGPRALRERAAFAGEQIGALLAEPPKPAVRVPQRALVAGALVPVSRQSPGLRQSGESGPGPEFARAAALAMEWGAAFWAVVAILLLARTVGGLWLAWRIRRLAAPVASADLRDRASTLARRLGIARPVALLESPDLDTPIATGWRRPAVILPLGLRSRLAPALLEPLIAHELEHVRRKDPPQAVLQALVEALVFFSPGARWLSYQVRLAREQCCDDVAVRACGDRAAYAAALGSLVGVVCERPALALAAAAPRLADRIRRVLEGEARRRVTIGQLTALAFALVITVASGLLVAAVSFADTLARPAPEQAQDQRSAASPFRPGLGAPDDPRAPSLVAVPRGAPVSVIGYGSASAAAPFETVRVRNVSEDVVRSITLAVVVELWHREGSAPLPTLPREPALVVPSEPIPVTLAPGEATSVSPALLSWAEIQELGKTHDAQPQPVLTVIAADLAGAGTWRLSPKPGARDHREALHRPASLVSQALVGTRPAKPLPGGQCQDESGLRYSQGAIVTVSDGQTKPGFARCEDGVWRAFELPSALY
jgi:beta-lactamase regulating signal transducer with metallopeptidase domain